MGRSLGSICWFTYFYYMMVSQKPLTKSLLVHLHRTIPECAGGGTLFILSPNGAPCPYSEMGFFLGKAKNPSQSTGNRAFQGVIVFSCPSYSWTEQRPLLAAQIVWHEGQVYQEGQNAQCSIPPPPPQHTQLTGPWGFCTPRPILVNLIRIMRRLAVFQTRLLSTTFSRGLTLLSWVDVYGRFHWLWRLTMERPSALISCIYPQ